MLISSECYHLYVSIGVLCVHVVCMHLVDKYTVVVSVMCMFAVFIYM